MEEAEQTDSKPSPVVIDSDDDDDDDESLEEGEIVEDVEKTDI